MSRYTAKMINWIIFNGPEVKPTEGISDARWRAMVAHIEREYLPDHESYVGYFRTS